MYVSHISPTWAVAQQFHNGEAEGSSVSFGDLWRSLLMLTYLSFDIYCFRSTNLC